MLTSKHGITGITRETAMEIWEDGSTQNFSHVKGEMDKSVSKGSLDLLNKELRQLSIKLKDKGIVSITAECNEPCSGGHFWTLVENGQGGNYKIITTGQNFRGIWEIVQGMLYISRL